MLNIHVIDEVMGSFKTTAIIDTINKNTKKKYIVVTPYLSECERIAEVCPKLHFKQPSNETFGSKTESLKDWLEKKKNIVMTHALFLDQKASIAELYKGYTLICDESLDGVIKDLDDIHQIDINHLFYDCIELDENHTAHWIADPKYSGRLKDVKQLCDEGCVKGYQNESGCQYIFKVFPSEIFRAFDEVFITTYIFKGSVFSCYLRSEGIYFDRWYISEIKEKHLFTSIPRPRTDIDYRPLIHLVHGCNGRFELPGADYYSLSKSWYEKEENDKNQIAKILHSFFFDRMKNVPGKRMWTTFKDFEKELAKGEIASSFVECSAKASNEYRECTKLAYTINRFIAPPIKIYFSQYGIEFDENLWALSQLIQWVWRSAIRDGKEIHLLIINSRMRNLFIDYLEYFAGDINPLRIKNADAIVPLQKSGFSFYKEIYEKGLQEERTRFLIKNKLDPSRVIFVNHGIPAERFSPKRDDIIDRTYCSVWEREP